MSRNGSTKQKTRIILESKQQFSGPRNPRGTTISWGSKCLGGAFCECPWWSSQVALKVSPMVPVHRKSLHHFRGNCRGCFGLPYPSNEAAKCWVYTGLHYGFPSLWTNRCYIWHLVIRIFSSRSCRGKASSHCMAFLASPMRSGMEYPKKKNIRSWLEDTTWRSYCVNLPCSTCCLESHRKHELRMICSFKRWRAVHLLNLQRAKMFNLLISVHRLPGKSLGAKFPLQRQHQPAVSIRIERITTIYPT